MGSPSFSAAELAGAVGGRWIGSTPPEHIRGVFTDTRAPVPGALFVALSGENFDAHTMLDKAVAGGAAALLIRNDRIELLPSGIAALAVEDTLDAYRKIGGFHRSRFPALKLAGVTGSVGKTSVKEMIRAIFEAAAGKEHVIATEGNTNNQIGVPRNLLRIDDGTEYAVIEMGSNHFGEIAPLAEISAPGVALVNSIAPCHLEFFGDLDGVAREKSTIYGGLEPGGVAVFPVESAGHDILEHAARPYRRFTFGKAGSGADFSCRYLGGNLAGGRFELTFPSGRKSVIQWTLSGAHQAMNGAAAAAVAAAFGVEESVIAAGLSRTALPGMRSKVIECSGVTYINDAYNASPAGMIAGFDWLAEFADPEQLILVLGEMRELGKSSREEHEKVAAAARERFPEARILFVGEAFEGSFADSERAGEALKKLVSPGDIVFVKGSRGVGMERALPPEAR